MKQIALILTLLAMTFSGCVAPGSAIGRIGFKALSSEPDQLPEKITVYLTKEYGLGGLDHYFGEPEDYGRKDMEVVATKKGDSLSVEFPTIAYHMSFWLLPPLGAMPRKPPPPFFYLRFSDSPNEVYIIGMTKKIFNYRVFERETRHEIEKESARWIIEDGEYISEEIDDSFDVNYLKIQITKSNNKGSIEP